MGLIIASEPNSMDSNDKKKLAVQFILLFGIVSALGDITYEGARSVYGPYLGFLGASATVIGLISGAGEFLGYFLRLVSGYFIDRTGYYWLVTILGYGMLISVPLLAIAGNWQIAMIFIMLERIGKAIRSPAKDTLLSHATTQVGRGFGFGIHEALDQIGAVIGPLIFASALALNNPYDAVFNLMWVPAILTIIVLLVARRKVPRPAMLEKGEHVAKPLEHPSDEKLPKAFWFYSVFIFLSVMGFANFQLIAYHLQFAQVVSEAAIPTLYAVAMAVDAVVALIIGTMYDKKGMSLLIIVPIMTLPIPFLAFGSYKSIIAMAVLWGAVMGIHETIMRASIADLSSIHNRGFAFGIFNTFYGIAWLIGSSAMGFLYDVSISYIFSFVVVTESMAVMYFIKFRNKFKITG